MYLMRRASRGVWRSWRRNSAASFLGYSHHRSMPVIVREVDLGRNIIEGFPIAGLHGSLAPGRSVTIEIDRPLLADSNGGRTIKPGVAERRCSNPSCSSRRDDGYNSPFRPHPQNHRPQTGRGWSSPKIQSTHSTFYPTRLRVPRRLARLVRSEKSAMLVADSNREIRGTGRAELEIAAGFRAGPPPGPQQMPGSILHSGQDRIPHQLA